jgi:hypothetical protein
MQMKTFFLGFTCTLLTSALLLTWQAPQASAGVAKVSQPVFTKHFNKTLFDLTASADFSVEILLDNKEYKKLGKDVVGLVIHDSHDHDVEKAAIAIDYRDVETAKPAAEVPVLKERGGGLYTVSNLDLQRKGRWKLTITVKKGAVEDSVQFLLPDALKDRVPAGRYNP